MCTAADVYSDNMCTLDLKDKTYYLSEDLEKIRKKDPEKAIELALKLMEYTLPKLSRTEMKAEIEQKIQSININITKSGSKD